MKNATKASKNKKRLINKERLEFEKLLDSTLKESFLTKNVNTALAKRVAENICHKHPEFQSCMQHIPFQQKYFLAFFKRYGWKWGQVKGTKKYYPKEVIEKEIERINGIMQNYQKKKHLEHRRVFTILSRQGVGIESQNPQYEFKEAFFDD